MQSVPKELPALTRLWGIYNADGSLLGELRYVFGKLIGTAHCGLCDITHRGVRQKPAFVSLRERLPLTLECVHLDERSPGLEVFSAGMGACVVGEGPLGFELLLSSEQLDDCAGSVEELERAIAAAMSLSRRRAH